MSVADPQTAVVERLRLVRGGRPFDRDAVESAVAALLFALGEDGEDGHLRETPRRVADAYAEMLTPRPFEATSFPNDEGYRSLVLVREIPFSALCRHHLLPFTGVAHVG